MENKNIKGACTMRIRIDNRENSRIQKAETYYAGHDTTVEQLPVGDYLFNDQVVFEFKTIRDFIGSVRDKRVFQQAERQSEQYPYHFVIIQGTSRDQQSAFDYFYHIHRPFNLRQMTGAIARLNTYTTVIRVGTLNEAFLMMEKQATKCLDNESVKKYSLNTENMAYNLLCSIQGIGRHTARSITDELGLKTLQELLNVKQDDLLSVNGVGEKTSQLIIENIGE